MFLSSADWMDRNFFRRVEIAFPVEDAELKERIISDLDNSLSDTYAWELRPDGTYVPRELGSDELPLASQTRMLEKLADTV